jgi:hypothetical protein
MVINPPKSAKGAIILANFRVGSMIIASEMVKAQKGQISSNNPLDTRISSFLIGLGADQKSVN